jgi:hypothetical protein
MSEHDVEHCGHDGPGNNSGLFVHEIELLLQFLMRPLRHEPHKAITVPRNTWQMDAILFWHRFQGRWLRGDEFHYPEVRQDLPPLKDLPRHSYDQRRPER